MNSAARLVFSSSRYDHITPLLRQLHWLKAAERIDFKLAVLVYKCLHGAAPSYLADELCLSADLSPRRRLRSAPSSSLVVRRRAYASVNHRRQSFSCRRRTRVERSAAARNICTLSVYFSQTSEDSSLPALLPLTVCVVPEQWLLSFSDTLIVRVTYLLETYLYHLSLFRCNTV